MTTIILNTGITAAISFIVGGLLSWIAAQIRHKRKQKKEDKCLLAYLAAGMMYLLKQDILDRCEKMLEQEPLPAPKFELDPAITNFYDFTPNSIRVTDYQYSPFEDKIPVAI